MADIPIIFSAPMVLALLAGRKTMTRRLAWSFTRSTNVSKLVHGNPMLIDTHGHTTGPSSWQRVKPGDRLWVRENFSGPHRWRFTPIDQWGWDGCARTERPSLWYWADGNPSDGDWMKPKPSIHMPRWASRLTLVVEATKIERVQAISAGDVLAEGAPVVSSPDQPEQWMVEISAGYYQSPRLWFHRLWDSLHGAGAWEKNPEVVALSFKVHQQNIDSMEKAA